MGLFDIFSGDAARKAAETKAQGFQTGYSQLSDLYNQGRTALTTQYGKAADVYQPLYDLASKGYSSYADALGVNGPEGIARAQSAFTTSPGYQFQLGQGLSAIDRGAASRGALGSGGALAAEQAYGSGLAGKEYYSNYLPALSGFGGQALTAAGNLGNVYTGLGTGLATSYGAQGTGAYNAAIGAAGAKAEGEMADYNASANTWNAIFNAGKLGAQIAGYAMGGPAGGAAVGALTGGPTQLGQPPRYAGSTASLPYG